MLDMTFSLQLLLEMFSCFDKYSVRDTCDVHRKSCWSSHEVCVIFCFNQNLCHQV